MLPSSVSVSWRMVAVVLLFFTKRYTATSYMVGLGEKEILNGCTFEHFKAEARTP